MAHEHNIPRPTPTLPSVQALRALKAAQGTLEGLPTELLGRVNQSGRWSFKQMLEAASPERSPEGRAGSARARAAAAAAPGSGGGATQSQLSAAQKATLSAMALLNSAGAAGSIAAHRVSPR